MTLCFARISYIHALLTSTQQIKLFVPLLLKKKKIKEKETKKKKGTFCPSSYSLETKAFLTRSISIIKAKKKKMYISIVMIFSQVGTREV